MSAHLSLLLIDTLLQLLYWLILFLMLDYVKRPPPPTHTHTQTTAAATTTCCVYVWGFFLGGGGEGGQSQSHHCIIPSPCHLLLNMLCGSGLFKCVVWGWIWGTSVHLSIDLLLVVLTCCVSGRHVSASLRQHATHCLNMLCGCGVHQRTSSSTCCSLFKRALLGRSGTHRRHSEGPGGDH